MEYESPDDMVFGFAKHPVKTVKIPWKVWLQNAET